MSEIALLIPVYNDQMGLNKTLDSLLDETEESLDVVIVDDGSKRELIIPKNIGIHNIIFIKSKINRGIEYVLNLGLNYIRENGYRYVARIDAGDIIAPNRFFKQKQYLVKNLECMLIGSHVKHVDLNGGEVFIEYVPTTKEQIKRKMHLNSCFPHPSVMFRTSILEEVGQYHTDFPAAEDYDFFFRISNNYTVSNIDEILVYKEINPNSISLSKRKVQLKSRMKIQRRYFNPFLLESYIGIIKTFILLVSPNNLVIGAKSILSKSHK